MRFPISARLRSLILASAAATSLVTPGRAHAQSADAEALFTEGLSLLKAGKLVEACEALEGSNRIETRAGTLIRLGECREKNHQLASAWSAYRDALGRVKDPAKRALATAKVAELENQLSYLTVSVPDESRIEGLVLTRDRQIMDPALWNRATPIDGGTYAIGGKVPGHEAWQTTVEVPVSGGKVSVEVPKFKELAKLVPTPRIAKDPTAEPDDDGEPVQAPTVVGWTPRRKLAVGMLGGSVASLGVGLAFGLSSRGKAHDALALCPDPRACERAPEATALTRTARTQAVIADVAFGVSAAAAIGAGVLWFVGGEAPERRRSISVVPSTAPGSSGVAVVGAF